MKKEKKEINPRNLLKIKPFDWGPGTERTSKEIDKILYGSKSFTESRSTKKFSSDVEKRKQVKIKEKINSVYFSTSI